MTDSRLATDASGTGDCFSVAFNLVHDNPSWTLCHGSVVRDEDGLHHSHAWVERDEVVEFPNYGPVRMRVVVDRANGNDCELPAEFYRKLGGAYDVTEYECMEAMRLAVRSGHYGPWVTP